MRGLVPGRKGSGNEFFRGQLRPMEISAREAVATNVEFTCDSDGNQLLGRIET